MYVCVCMYINITYKYKCIYIYVIPPPAMDLPFSCVWEPHHTKMVDPWGEGLADGPLPFCGWVNSTLARLNSIGADWVQSGAGFKIEDFLESSIRAPIEFNRGRLSSIGGRIEDWRFPGKLSPGIFNLQSGPRLSSIAADWVQSGPIEFNRGRLSAIAVHPKWANYSIRHAMVHSTGYSIGFSLRLSMRYSEGIRHRGYSVR